MFKKTKLILTAIVVIAVVAAALYLYFSLSSPKKTIDVDKGKVSRIETMARLCTVDIYSEVTVLDTINDKVMFAIQKQKGSVSFDLEKLKVDADGDTVQITLPPEIVELYESTDKNSWEVIDTKAIGRMAMFRSDKFTIAEENAVKAKIKEKSTKLLYRNGTIERARAEGARNLQSLMEMVYDKPVLVTDPTPKGARYAEYR